jgi:hypothetical protein
MEFAAFPIIFEENLKWPQSTSGLSFLGMMIGQIGNCSDHRWNESSFGRWATVGCAIGDFLIPAVFED